MKLIWKISAVALFACTLSAKSDTVDGIKVVVDDTPVTQVDVDLDMLGRGAVESLQRQFVGQAEMFQKKLAQAESDSVERLLDRQLILHEFKSLKVPETTSVPSLLMSTSGSPATPVNVGLIVRLSVAPTNVTAPRALS